MTENRIKYAEFFAGVGLVREGLSDAQFQCTWANDISSDKRDTYIENFGKDDFVLEDIWEIAKDPSTIPDDTFLYTASFPCTDLSVAGGRKGLAGTESGTLNALLEILRKKNSKNCAPKVVLLENVKGFLTSHKGQDVADTVGALNKLDYTVDIIELDAMFFTPQSRPRVFLIAVKKTLASEVMKLKNPNSILDSWWAIFDSTPSIRSTHLKSIITKNPQLQWGLFDIPQPQPTKDKLASIIEKEIPEDSNLWWNEKRQSHLFNQMSDRHKNILETMISKQTYSYGTVYRRMRKGKSMAELRVDGKAGCLRTPRGGSSKQILIRAGFEEWKVRLLSPREYARLQGARDSFILPENANKGYFAMGDAVCVPAIEYLAKHVLIPTFKSDLSILTEGKQHVLAP